MFAKSLLTGTMFLLSLTSVQAAQSSLAIFSDSNCKNVISARSDVVNIGSGCTDPLTVQPFKSVKLDWSYGLTGVSVCGQGYSCQSGSYNIVNLAGKCLKANGGSFDKIQYCVS